MFQNEMVEAGEGVLAVKDMSGESMEQLLKHIYTGSEFLAKRINNSVSSI
jgi:hypothetical protein